MKFMISAALAALLLAYPWPSFFRASPDTDDLALSAAATSIRDAAVDRQIVVIGELHGTREIPLLVARLVDGWAKDGPVRVALELSHAHQPALDRWVSGGDRAAALQEMRAVDPLWTRAPEFHDGRRNLEVLDLLDHLRALRAAGRNVGVLAFDGNGASEGAAARDLAMAERLRAAHAALPDTRWIVVTGNVHAMKFVPEYCPQCQESLTKHLVDLRPFAVDVSAAAGAFHACSAPAPCGPIPVRTNPASAGRVRDDRTPFDYRVVLPRFTPARMP